MFVILDEYFLAGEVMETSKTQVCACPQHIVFALRLYFVRAHTVYVWDAIYVFVVHDKTHARFVYVRVCMRAHPHASAHEPRRVRRKSLAYSLVDGGWRA